MLLALPQEKGRGILSTIRQITSQIHDPGTTPADTEYVQMGYC